MPDNSSKLDDFDFAGEMQYLASQAEAKSSGGSGAVRMDRNDLLLALGQMLRPLAFELEAVKRGNTELHSLLSALTRNAGAQSAAPSGAIEAITAQLQRMSATESAQQKLFDAMHTELKGYKDNFLFDALQRPFVKDVVSLFDDFSVLKEQVLQRQAALKDANGKNGKDNGETEFLATLAGNVENQFAHMVEVFSRNEVTLSQTAAGAPLDMKTHKIIAFEPAASPEENDTIVRSARPGVVWRDRTVRPEEVVVRRWKPAPAPATTIEEQPAGARPKKNEK